MFRELPGESLVVDETHTLQAGEDVVDLLGLEPGGEEPPLELSPAPRPNGE